MFHHRILIPAAGLLLLCACDGGQPEQSAGQGGGEVLPGTISDDMLPYASATSQPPLMAVEPEDTATGTTTAAAAPTVQETPAAASGAGPDSGSAEPAGPAEPAAE